MSMNRADTDVIQKYRHNLYLFSKPVPKQTFYNSYLKRFVDTVFAVIGLILAAVIVLLAMAAIKLESRGPALFVQERVGLNGKKLKIIKLRSMTLDAEKNGAQWAAKNDARVTRVGSFLRKTRIDELPQLINVIKGDMSLIGPRPERPMFVKQFEEEIPGFSLRLQVKPGLTGWAQVNGGYDISPFDKARLDLYYISKMGFLIDASIAFKTIKVIFTGEGAR